MHPLHVRKWQQEGSSTKRKLSSAKPRRIRATTRSVRTRRTENDAVSQVGILDCSTRQIPRPDWQAADEVSKKWEWKRADEARTFGEVKGRTTESAIPPVSDDLPSRLPVRATSDSLRSDGASPRCGKASRYEGIGGYMNEFAIRGTETKNRDKNLAAITRSGVKYGERMAAIGRRKGS